MTHAAEGTLQAWLDGELATDEQSGLADHLEGCGECRDRAAELRAAAERLSAALSLVDVAPPARVAPAPRRRTFAAPLAGGLARAAGLALILAGGAAALIPGSPLRRLIEDALRTLRGPEPAVVVEAPAAPPQDEVVGGAVYVAPANGAVRVNLVAPSAGARVVVLLVDQAEAAVDAERTGPGFGSTSGAGWVNVEGIEDGLVTVRIPRTAATATVEVDGRVVVRKEDGQLVRTPSAGGGPSVQVDVGG